MFDISSIDQHFPMAQFREGQRECIEFAANEFNNGKDIVIIEAPTGSGKSAIGMTLADMVPQSYYITVTKILQDQLVQDFGDKIVELKGRNAYPCTYWDRIGRRLVEKKGWTDKKLTQLRLKHSDCSNGFCRTTHNNSNRRFRCDWCFTNSEATGPGGELTHLPAGMVYSACPYYEQVYKAVNGRKVVMNFSSFLYQTQFVKKRFNDPRDLLIIDEGHNIEPQILDFVSLVVTDANLQKSGIFIPNLDTAEQYAIWFDEIKLGDILGELIEEAKNDENTIAEDELTKMLFKYNMFMRDITSEAGGRREWVADFEAVHTKTGSVMHRKVTLRPVFAHHFARGLLLRYARKTLIMSATILDVNVMCKSLGLNRDAVASYRMSNRFPKENRPIYIKGVAKMTGGKEASVEWLPKLTAAVNKICKGYAGKRGIIHTHNFAILDHLVENCDDEVRSRFVHQRTFPDKQLLLRQHSRNPDSIIVAPAMHEGLNLADDLSRFQIICKVPYANFFDDRQLARRVELDPKYYKWLTALKLCQSAGRSIRSETDYADTFILDSAIHRFLKESQGMIPAWFTEALHFASN